MSKSNIHKVDFGRAALLVMLLSIGCSGDVEPDQPFREDVVAAELEASLESALRTLDSDDIEITYYEASSSMDVRVNLEQFAELAQGFTVEVNIDVKLPDGMVTRQELEWTSGDDLEIPRIAWRAADRGRYEVTLTSLAIDGRTVLDAPAPLQNVELLKEGAPAAQGLQVHALDDGLKYLVCKWHSTILNGTILGETVYGGKGTKDSIHGWGGDDVLISGKCNDQLWGDEGNDVLQAGSDYDTCIGGPGVDTYVSCEKVVDPGEQE